MVWFWVSFLEINMKIIVMIIPPFQDLEANGVKRAEGDLVHRPGRSEVGLEDWIGLDLLAGIVLKLKLKV